jgi:Ca2+-binding RTX toxin-like protein
MATLFITDDMVTDGVVNGYSANQIDFSQVTIPLQFTYTPYYEDLVFAPATATDPQLTGDTIKAQIYTLTRFNDTFYLSEGHDATNVYGGDGNDNLATSENVFGASLNGGNGDDVLTGGSPDRDHLRGDAGNDVLIMSSGDQGYGGTGADRFVLNDPTGNSAFITDLSASGTYHDLVDLWLGLKVAGYEYNSFTEALNAGTLGVTYQNGYTLLSFDTNGDHVADHEFAHIKGIVTPDQYDQTFLVTYAQSYYGKIHAGDDVLDGTANPARDHLSGGPGNDILIMGDTDEATGGTGMDRFVLTKMDGASAFITDLFPTATGYDVVDMWKPLNDAGYSYDSFTEAQSAGTLGVSYQNGYTKLLFDTNGDHLPDHEFAHIKGVVPGDYFNSTFLVSQQSSYFGATS